MNIQLVKKVIEAPATATIAALLDASIPFSYTSEDPNITPCSLNDAPRPEYEVRFCVDSNGSNTLAFLPLPTDEWIDEWIMLVEQYDDAFDKRFYKIAPQPNLFTDSLPF